MNLGFSSFFMPGFTLHTFDFTMMVAFTQHPYNQKYSSNNIQAAADELYKNGVEKCLRKN